MKSLFIGTAELLYSKKNNYNYLRVCVGTWEMLGFESKSSKNSFNIVENFRKIIWQHLHDKKDPKSNPIPNLKIMRLVNCGNLKLKFLKKSGIRILDGSIQGIDMVAYEDLRIRNKFHIKIDFDGLAELVNKNPGAPEGVEVITGNTGNIPAPTADEGNEHELLVVSQ